ncbi:hypothetical protein KAU51_04230 [Candidatus Parcubacteria bacterium]|nr:hypothetical protein [Candidatus Parcubacteria bacterium]
MKNTAKDLKKMMDVSDEILEIVDDANEMTRSDLQARVEAFVRINFIK